MVTWVSDRHQFDETTSTVITHPENTRRPYSGINIKVEIYHQRVQDWFVNPVLRQTSGGMSPHDYIALMVSIAQLEGIQQFIEGETTPRGESGNWFKKSAQRAFPGHPDHIYDRLWRETRCGLFHVGFPTGKIYLSHDRDAPILTEAEKITINPHVFLINVQRDFENYIHILSDENNLNERLNFEQLWDELWNKS